MNYGIGAILAVSFAGTVYNTQFDLYHQAMVKVQEIDNIQQAALQEADKLTANYFPK